MRTIKERKLAAKASLGNGIFSTNWMSGVLVNLIMWGATAIAGALSVGVLSLLVLGPLACGLCACYLKNAMDHKKIEVENMFAAFKVDFGGTFILGLLMDVFLTLWTLLFIIPGIVKYYSYSMSYYVKSEHPEYTWRQCIDASRQLMKGHKAELFWQDFSFIGWAIVGSLCLGIGFLWVNAYAEAAKAEFYKDLVGKANVVDVTFTE